MANTATARAATRLGIAAMPSVIVACALAIWLAGVYVATNPTLPHQAQLRNEAYTADLDGDGSPDTLYLSDGLLRIRPHGGDRYLSPQNWAVADAFVADLDGAGDTELVLVVWKRGSFGTSRPFWVERDTAAMTLHVFVMRFADGGLVPVWMSSALEGEMRDIHLDGQNRLHMVDGAGTPLTWEWDHWGFTLVDGDAEEPEGSSGNLDDDAGEAPGAQASSGTGAPGASEETALSGTGAQASSGTQASQQGAVSLIAVGDNIAHTAICADAHNPETGRYDFTNLFAPVAERIAAYDLAAVCQETILVNDRSAVSDYPDFGTPLEMGDALADAGFDIVEAATNHAFDKGLAGIGDTLAFWVQRHEGITLLGLHATADDARSVDYVEVGGMRFALFDYTYDLNGHVLPAGEEYHIDTLDDIDLLVADLGQAEREADLSICFLHIGDEYASAPSDYQRQVVERIADAGADVVICSHPHVVQPAERLTTPAGAEAVVFWSLGNFASRQTDVSNIVGGAASVTFGWRSDGTAEVASFELLPIVCHYEPGITQVYFLNDYTDELAGAHALSTPSNPLTVQRLYDEFASRTGVAVFH